MASAADRGVQDAAVVLARALRRPSVDFATAISRSVRSNDEWFDEPDDIDGLAQALSAVDNIDDRIVAAGVLAFRVTRAQAFGEGNKRTALILSRWILDRNEVNGSSIIRPDDYVLADLLVKPASGLDVETEIVNLLLQRAKKPSGNA